MHSLVNRVLLSCCPQTSFQFPSGRSDYVSQEDRNFEKYEPRPQIVINPDVSRVTAQYSQQKTTVIIKVSSLHGFTDCTEEDELGVRLIVEGSKNPKQMTSYIATHKAVRFRETFTFPGIDEKSLKSNGIKFRVYKRKGKSRGSLKGEGLLEGKNVSLEGPQQLIVPINQLNTLKSEASTGLSPSMHRMSNGSFANGDSRRSSMVDSCGRFCSQPNAESAELLMALCYDQDQNAITVSIEKGSQIGDKSKPPDTFVKVTACVEFGQEFWRTKTEMTKGTSEPLYDFTTSCQLPKGKDVLDNTTVKIEVWQAIGMLRRRILLGTISLGLNSSSPDAQEHWEQMVKAHGIAISKWHTLTGQQA